MSVPAAAATFFAESRLQLWQARVRTRYRVSSGTSLGGREWNSGSQPSVRSESTRLPERRSTRVRFVRSARSLGARARRSNSGQQLTANRVTATECPPVTADDQCASEPRQLTSCSWPLKRKMIPNRMKTSHGNFHDTEGEDNSDAATAGVEGTAARLLGFKFAASEGRCSAPTFTLKTFIVRARSISHAEKLTNANINLRTS